LHFFAQNNILNELMNEFIIISVTNKTNTRIIAILEWNLKFFISNSDDALTHQNFYLLRDFFFWLEYIYLFTCGK